MKNIHILPTDKPSRLVLETINNNLFLTTTKDFGTKIMQFQNIYITNSEKPKEGDWKIYFKNGIIFKIFKYDESINIKNCKKIIITDNEDLIKDGVQDIDDEFLEWFVKNPSCEEVNVVGDDCYYEIIIPKAISRCCGRCNGVDDLCYTDMCCEEHSKYGCDECYGPKVTYKINSTECGNKNCQGGVINGINPKICKKCNPDSNDLYAEFEKWVNSNYSTGIQNKSTAFDAARFGAEWKEKQTNDKEMISLIRFLASDVMFTHGFLCEQTAKFFLRRYKNSK